MPTLGHHGHRLRKDIIAVLGHPNYCLVRLRDRRGRRKWKKVAAHRRDEDRRPFIVDFEIRRKLRGRREGFGKALKLVPSRSSWGRWDIVVKIGGSKQYFHRLVGMSVTPLCTDKQGRIVEPRFLGADEVHLFEVHHGDDDVKFCVSDSLHVLHPQYHRSLERRRA